MPTYQYRCTECGDDLEAVQKFTDSALTECPTCGGPLRKVFNAVGVVFKGTGFYRTDSRTGDSTDGESGKADGMTKDVTAKTNGKESAASEKSAKSSAGKDSSTADSGGRHGRSDKVGAAAS
jgi:putative FmdB family regulatory protein